MPSYRSLLKTGLGAVAAIPLTLAVASQAQALPYAYASNIDTNFAITAVPGSGTYAASAGTFQTLNGISSDFLPAAITSATGTGLTTSDAKQVYSGPAAAKPIENTFTQALTGVTSPAMRADSFDSGFAGSGGNVAEANFQGGPAGGSGSAFGKLNSNNTSTISLSVGAGTKLLISFNDTVGLQAQSRPLNGEVANAAISSSVTIQKNGVTVFTFVPNGQAGNGDVTGGTAVSDPYSLNTNVGTSGTGSLTGSYSKTGGLFQATTDALSNGNYTIIINQQSNIDLAIGTPTATPEPASLALLGAGLVGFGVLRRNRKSS